MITKTVALLVLVSVGLANQVSDPNNVGDRIDDLLKKLQEVVDKAVAEARQELMSAEAVVNQTAAEAENAAKSALQGLQNSFQKELDDLKAQAKKANVNIDECLGQDEQTLVNLPTATANDMVKCVQGLIIQAVNYVNDALTKIQQTADDVAQIKEEIKKCGKGWKSIKCLAELGEKIEKEVVALPSQITADVNNVITLFENIKAEVKKCGTDAVDNCESKGKALLAKISACVASKIIHH